jgi:predicted O-methyltransferase YrrM
MKHYTQIDGWFDYKATFDFLLSKVPDNGVFVECGSWLGKSSSYLCDISQNRVNVFIVDTWLGSQDELNTNQKLAQETDIYSLFLENMGDRLFRAIRMPSIEAVKTFENASCDVVFIDMDHSYESVKQDLEIWYPKVKSGGYIAGHDYTSDWKGVVQAVNERFPTEDIIKMDTCWIYRKE